MSFETLEVWGSGGPLTTPVYTYTGVATIKSAVISTPESRILQQIKNEINTFYEEGKWDDYKKITNPFEYVFLSWNRRSSRSVTTRQPLSRSYFKMIELWKNLGLSKILLNLVRSAGGNLRTAHAAEGPGGFIEASIYSAEQNKWNFQSANAITLRSEAKNVPGWRKASKFLTNYPQVLINDGADGTGNILTIENQNHFVNTVRETYPDGVHLYTADGGFDFSSDYNAQEDSILPLFLAEILIGLRVLSKGGCMVIKCFDTTEQPTLDLIWLASRAFCEWGIVKPRTSRAGNAERYIIGKGFIESSDDIIKLLISYQTNQNFKIPIIQHRMCESYRSLLSSILTLQEQIEHNEIRVIQETLELIKKTEQITIRNLVRANVLRSIEWCKEHDEEIAPCWLVDFEKNIAKETTDLLHLLNPTHNVLSYSNTNWTKSTISGHLSFEGFRNGSIISPTVVLNPFIRPKK